MILRIYISTIMNINSLNKWNITPKFPLIISGPCSAESRDQLFNTALEISQNCPQVSLFRAGIWKPRTRPGSFEGHGKKALKWLKEVKDTFEFNVTTEVATPQQAYEAIDAGIDTLWIGARTTVNPFYVEEIAQALKGTNVSVLIKNPIHADISAWIGSIERVYKSGIKNIAAIHRGFYSYKRTKYRNEPNWEIVFKLRQLLPKLPIIVDPSHMAGNTIYIKDLSQEALDLDFDGLMIEVHNNPSKALSDSAQQLTPFELKTLLEELKLRNQSKVDVLRQKDLQYLRAEIDICDKDILDLLCSRMEVVNKIAKIKEQTNLSLYQSQRWTELIQDRMSYAKEKGLDESFIASLLQTIHTESIAIQKNYFNEKEH